MALDWQNFDLLDWLESIWSTSPRYLTISFEVTAIKFKIINCLFYPHKNTWKQLFIHTSWQPTTPRTVRCPQQQFTKKQRTKPVPATSVAQVLAVSGNSSKNLKVGWQHGRSLGVVEETHVVPCLNKFLGTVGGVEETHVVSFLSDGFRSWVGWDWDGIHSAVDSGWGYLQPSYQ